MTDLDTAGPVALQRRYYADTAETYDGMHERSEHLDALKHIAHYLPWIGANSVLDTACGTGLAMRYLSDAIPGLPVHGNDHSAELLEVATSRYGIPAASLDEASSEALPYGDGQFDAVVETGALHHVPDAEAVVKEMLRVAGKAIFISDENIYGMGSLPSRAAKLALAKTHLLGPVNRRRRGGNDWYFTEGDGVAWTYSVFDSFKLIEEGCAEVLVIPLKGAFGGRAERWPLVFASHILLAGFKEPLPHASQVA